MVQYLPLSFYSYFESLVNAHGEAASMPAVTSVGLLIRRDGYEAKIKPVNWILHSAMDKDICVRLSHALMDLLSKILAYFVGMPTSRMLGSIRCQDNLTSQKLGYVRR